MSGVEINNDPADAEVRGRDEGSGLYDINIDATSRRGAGVSVIGNLVENKRS